MQINVNMSQPMWNVVMQRQKAVSVSMLRNQLLVFAYQLNYAITELIWSNIVGYTRFDCEFFLKLANNIII